MAQNLIGRPNLALSDPIWPFLAQVLIGWPFLAQFLIGWPFLVRVLIG